MSWSKTKPKYIRKYDYKRSYTRTKDQWFWPVNEIETVLIDKIMAEYKKQHKDLAIDTNNADNINFDYEKDLDLEQFNDEDKDEAIIKEGQIIDKLARQYIKSIYPKNLVVNFDDPKYKSLSNEQITKETLKLLKNKENVLIFQACFIAARKAIAKPDAILKRGNKLTLIEVKSTCKYKKNDNYGWDEKKFTDKKTKKHILDLVYQKQIIEKALEEFKLSFSISCQLCTINNRKPARKYTTNFAIVKCDSIIRNFYDNYKDVINNFWDRIDELIQTKISSSFSLEPNHDNCGPFGDNESWQLFKEYYYVSSKYPFFGLSTQTIINPRALKGTAIWYLYDKYKDVDPTNLKEMVERIHQENCLSTSGLRYYGAIANIQKHPNYCFSKTTLHVLSKKLKKKKIYFDFETLNSALAAFDGCYPYKQVVVQVSIIKDHGNGKLISENLICDPKNITIKWFKKVVDSILDGIDDIQEYSFVVYNKTFEHKCLNDIAHYINEKEYTDKIVSFNGPLDTKKENHLFDLADFFDNRKSESCYIWSLKGFYSIKKVLDFVMNDKKSNAFKLAGCKNYKSLKVQNGGQAQNEINNRFFGIISDTDWKKEEKNLKQYCENDVRAMIALEYWLKEHNESMK